jgi:hypothetical protein
MCLLLLTGCSTPFVRSPTAAAPPPYTPRQAAAPTGEIVQASAGSSAQQIRVEEVARKVLAANPQLALRPRVAVTPAAELGLTHEGDYRVQITQGMVNSCASDGQLAAVLAWKFAQMSTERQARVEASLTAQDREPMPDVRIGPDQTIGDLQLRNAELSKLGYTRRRNPEPTAPPQDPTPLARQILAKTGYAAIEMDAVLPWIQPTPPSGR